MNSARPWPDLSAPSGLAPDLTPAEAARLHQLQQALLQALADRDRAALRQAQGNVLQAAYHRVSTGSPEAVLSPRLRSALRDLAWRMCALRLHRASNPAHQARGLVMGTKGIVFR
jgi:hypothetical protein